MICVEELHYEVYVMILECVDRVIVYKEFHSHTHAEKWVAAAGKGFTSTLVCDCIYYFEVLFFYGLRGDLCVCIIFTAGSLRSA